MRATRSITALLGTTLALATVVGPGPLSGQDGAPSPETVAEEFRRGFQSMAWAGLVQRIHPEGLAYIRISVDILVQVDTTGYVLDRLLGGTAPTEYEGLPDGEVVRRGRSA